MKDMPYTSLEKSVKLKYFLTSNKNAGEVCKLVCFGLQMNLEMYLERRIAVEFTLFPMTLA